MILHLAEDEKFIDHVIDIFEEVCPGNNVYFIAVDSNNDSLKFVKSNNENIIYNTIKSDVYLNILDEKDKYDFVILHNLISPYKQEFIRNSCYKIKIHWMCWGADLYRIPELKNKHAFHGNKKKKRRSFNKFLGDLLEFLFPKTWYKYYQKPKNIPPTRFENNKKFSQKDIEYKKIFKKINTASAVTFSDELLIKKHLNNDIEFLPFKYVSIEEITSGKIQDVCNGNNILIGNSAALSNNHIEVLKFFNFPLEENQKVYVPLSYGDELYSNKVIKSYGEIFDQKFIPMTKFLPMVDYYEIVKSCRHVIMNHRRQQAMGNIILSLWLGSYVYLHPKNPLYKDLKKLGLPVFSISQFKKKSANYNSNELLSTRKILMKLYSRKSVVEQTIRLVDYYMNNKT